MYITALIPSYTLPLSRLKLKMKSLQHLNIVVLLASAVTSFLIDIIRFSATSSAANSLSMESLSNTSASLRSF